MKWCGGCQASHIDSKADLLYHNAADNKGLCYKETRFVSFKSYAGCDSLYSIGERCIAQHVDEKRLSDFL
jgi:hypothetical protein